MNRADVRRWRAAYTLADLGELTARWLERRIIEHPGYSGKQGPDAETTENPELVAALVALNRIGLVTADSQPGFLGRGSDGAWWVNRAALAGYCDAATLDTLGTMLRHTPYELIAHQMKARWWHRAKRGVWVTTCDGRYRTGFGWQLGATHVSRDFGHELRDEAREAVYGAWQVTIYDPVWSRNTMWADLESAISRGPGAGQ